MKTIIHVNRNVLAANKKHGRNEPAIIIRQGAKRTYCHEVEIAPGIRMVHREAEPLDCGARVYLVMDSGETLKVIA